MSIPLHHITKAKQDLAHLVSIPSVSTRGQSLDECAKAVGDLLTDAGFSTSIHPGDVGPFVVGEIGNGPETIMIYNHYDVQPEDPIDLWTSPPFELTERDNRLYGRGVADDKGEFISRLAGWNLFREHHSGDLPFRLIWIVDGEEEIASPSLDRFIAEKFGSTKVDFCWWEYGEIDANGRPIVLLGFKGIMAAELRLRTAKADLHSSLGAIFQNPLWRLASAAASLRDNEGKVLIEGFYDKIATPSSTSLEAVSSPPYSLESLKQATGASQMLQGTDQDNFYPKLSFTPCVNINGFSGGYEGEGTQTVLPAFGKIKIDFRLVPDQEPKEIVSLLRSHLDKNGFEDIELIVHDAEVEPVRTPPDHWAIACAQELLEKWFKRKPILQPSSPGSGTAHPFSKRLGAAIIGIGLTHHGAMLHSPDENIIIDQFEKMIGFSADYFNALVQYKRKT